MSRSGQGSFRSDRRQSRSAFSEPETWLSLHLITDGLPVRSRPRGKVVATYILRRLGLALVTLWLLSVIVFFAGQVLPGVRTRDTRPAGRAERRARARYPQAGVNRPLLAQYWSWISGLAHGDMGTSYQFRTPVAPFIGAALVNSVKLPRWRSSSSCRSASPAGWSRRCGSPGGRPDHLGHRPVRGHRAPEFVSGIVLIVIFGGRAEVAPGPASASAGAWRGPGSTT